jgi:tetratricopeptide (TPR) repeat protein
MNDECRMQNEESKAGNLLFRSSFPRPLPFIIHHSSFIIICLLAVGCTITPPAPQPPPPPPASLVSANQALASNMPDAAISDAQSYLRSQPTGPQAAEAWYFQGRGFEMKTASNPGDIDRNLFDAHSCYLKALEQSPPSPLEGDIRASLSNVAYFQDEYPEAIREATAAIPLVSSPQTKSFLLFRIGVSQQRLGLWTDADLTFHQVEQKYPGTPLAEAARDHEGQKEFYVQLATYDTRDTADRALTTLRSSGVILSERTDAKGITVVDKGPYATYSEAKKVKDELVKTFPSALIVP